MTAKETLIKEIECIPESLVNELLGILHLRKNWGDSDFFATTDLDLLAKQQGVHPLKTNEIPDDLWPGDENIDDFITSVRQWREQN